MALFAQILVASLRSIGVTASAVAIGVLLARRGTLSPASRKSLSEVSMNALIPALLFTKIIYCNQCDLNSNLGLDTCKRCQPIVEVIAQSWILILLPVVVVGLGVVVGSVASRLTRCPANFSTGAVCAVAFGNSTGMVIVLLTVVERSLQNVGAFGKVDPLLILPVYLILYPVLQWSIGGWLLGIGRLSSRRPAASDPEAGPSTTGTEESDSEESSQAGTETRMSSYRRSVTEILSNALVPPVIATLVGLVVGLTPLRDLLLDLKDQDGDAPLEFVYDGLYLLGQAAVPVNLLVLGGTLASGADFQALPLRVGAAIAVSKLVLLPALMTLVVYALIRIVQVPQPQATSLWLIALIVSCTPTANNVAVMAQLGGQSKEAMATAIFLQYLVAPVFVTLSLTAFVMLLLSDAFLPS